MKKFFAEFKEFVSKGNVIDMAVGVVIGAAFKSIVDSLVNDIIMPVVGWLLGGLDFSSYAIKLSEKIAEDGSVAVNAILYGKFINTIISFIIISFCLFCVVKIVNGLRKKKEEEPAPEPEEPKPSNEEVLLTEIRDLLKEKAN
ncbi:MAG: large-conductance mechanosensitive channel protein MscL [Oscillospiraceae bacterium]|nr:large-conductance mechanosensitive channel protein MscL [Oscillospiraceae bacterium]